MVLLENRKVPKGDNIIQLTGLEKYSSGVYILQVYVNNEVISHKLILLK